ncbi:MAG: hypothetical protein SPF34_02625 [Helicobacter sp.]|nr:hypothetical protein [Helicobacter sp.]
MPRKFYKFSRNDKVADALDFRHCKECDGKTIHNIDSPFKILFQVILMKF